MKAGAADYLSKPLDLDEVKLLIDRLLEEKRVRHRAFQLAEDFDKRIYDGVWNCGTEDLARKGWAALFPEL